MRRRSGRGPSSAAKVRESAPLDNCRRRPSELAFASQRSPISRVRQPGARRRSSPWSRRRADTSLSVRRQCALLGVARSGVYRARKPANDNDAALMRRIDELFTAWPFFPSRRMTAMLRAEGVNVNRKRVQRLMRLMGIAALGPKPRTSKPAPGHRICGQKPQGRPESGDTLAARLVIVRARHSLSQRSRRAVRSRSRAIHNRTSRPKGSVQHFGQQSPILSASDPSAPRNADDPRRCCSRSGQERQIRYTIIARSLGSSFRAYPVNADIDYI